ncbi:t-SNARE [Cokeromyces recurvatus]|uniref:t-SNARE n=1 Tax=Cokeromyces recurvatus TaxID=90255 RepID=UPI002220A26D|nr:t-SNARE [Cokeromyces recurvatus]KAI7905925.1 t-SNARE [Cokeromyces recurvatus]
MEDPFLIVKSQVEDALVNATNLFESWKRIQQTVSSPRNQELLWTADELNSSLEAIELDIEDLEEALQAAQQNPSQFNLTVNDLNNRKSFLTQSRNTIHNMRKIMANPPSKKPYSPNDQSSSSSYQAARQNDNSLFIESQQQHQMMIMQDQDQHLDAIGGTLVNLKEIAGTMNREIDDQVILLDDLGNQVDRSEGKLKSAMRRVTTILKQEEGKPHIDN